MRTFQTDLSVSGTIQEGGQQLSDKYAQTGAPISGTNLQGTDLLLNPFTVQPSYDALAGWNLEVLSGVTSLFRVYANQNIELPANLYFGGQTNSSTAYFSSAGALLTLFGAGSSPKAVRIDESLGINMNPLATHSILAASKISGTVIEGDYVSGLSLSYDGQDTDERYALSGLGGGGGSSTLGGLTDVTIGTPVSGEVLGYNGSAWVNGPDRGEAAGTGASMTTADIQTRTVILESELAGDVTSIGVSGLAQYDHLEIVITARTDRSSQTDTISCEYNGDATAANYRFMQGLHGDGSTNSSGDVQRLMLCAGGTAPANVFGGGIARIGNSNLDQYKVITSNSTSPGGGGNDFSAFYAVNWESLDPIADLRMYPSNGDNFVSGTKIQIVGYKVQSVVTEVNTSPLTAVKAQRATTTLIQEVDLAGFTSGLIHFSGIPQDFDHLEFRVLGRLGDNGIANGSLLVQFNDDTTAENYDLAYHRFQGEEDDDFTHTGGSLADTRRVGLLVGSTSQKDLFGSVVGHVDWYARTGHIKMWESRSMTRDDNAFFNWQEVGSWSDTSAITDIRFTPNVGTYFESGCVFQLFGIKNENIVTDVEGSAFAAQLQMTSGDFSMRQVLLDETLAANGQFSDITVPSGVDEVRIVLEGASDGGDYLSIYVNGDTTEGNYESVRHRVASATHDYTVTADKMRIGYVKPSQFMYSEVVAQGLQAPHSQTMFRGMMTSDPVSIEHRTVVHNQAQWVSGLRVQQEGLSDFISGSRLQVFGYQTQSVVTDVAGSLLISGTPVQPLTKTVETMTLIERIDISTSGKMEFNNIPAGYDHLFLRHRLRGTDSAANGCEMTFNGDTVSANYRKGQHSASDGNHSFDGANTESFGLFAGDGQSAGQFSYGESRINDYTDPNVYKVHNFWMNCRTGATSTFVRYGMTEWESQAVISGLRVQNEAGDRMFVSGSYTELYGIKREQIVTDVSGVTLPSGVGGGGSGDAAYAAGSGLISGTDIYHVDFTEVAPSGDYVTQTEGDARYQASGQYVQSGVSAAAKFFTQVDERADFPASYRLMAGSGLFGLVNVSDQTEIWDVGQGTGIIVGNLDVAFDSGWGDARYSLSGAPGSGELNVTKKTIQTRTVLASSGLGAAGDITITDIPQTYDHLELRIRARSSVSDISDGSRLYFNGDTTDANYLFAQHYGGTTAEGAQGGNTAWAGVITGDTSPANVFGGIILFISDYTDAREKITQILNADARNDATQFAQHGMHQWENTDPISGLVFDTDGAETLLSGTTWELVGIKQEEVVTDVTGSGTVSSTKETIQTKTLLQTWAGDGSDYFVSVELPSGYDAIVLEGSTRNTATGAAAFDSPSIYFNSDETDANYWSQYFWTADAASSDAEANTATLVALQSNSHADATHASWSLRLNDYANTDREKTVEAIGHVYEEADGPNQTRNIVKWNSNAAVSGIRLKTAGSGWSTDSIIRVYGVKDQQVVTEVIGNVAPLLAGSGLTSDDTSYHVDFAQVQVSGSYPTKTEGDARYGISGNYITQAQGDVRYALSGAGGTGGAVTVTKSTLQTRTLLEEYVAPSGTATDWMSAAIPSGYDAIRVELAGKIVFGSPTWDDGQLYFNGDNTQGNYHAQYYRVNDATYTDGESLDNNVPGMLPTLPSPSWGYVTVDIADYAFDDREKVARVQVDATVDTDRIDQKEAVVHWDSQAAISGLRFAFSNPITSGTTVRIYGVKDQQVVTDVTGGGSLTVHSSGMMQVTEVIDRVVFTATSGGADFTIPSGYDYLRLDFVARTNSAGDNIGLLMYLNGDETAANYSAIEMYSSDGAATGVQSDGALFARVAGGAAASDEWGCGFANIYNHSNGSRRAHVVGEAGVRRATVHYVQNTSMGWEDTSVVTQIRVEPSADSFISGTILELVGIKSQNVVTSGSYGGLTILNGLIVP